ncbi:MAG: hypothetical protein WCO55_05555 [Candidatus Falkowbacteria bacterium]
MATKRQLTITAIISLFFVIAILAVVWYYYPLITNNQCLPLCDDQDQTCIDACRQQSSSLWSDAMKMLKITK